MKASWNTTSLKSCCAGHLVDRVDGDARRLHVDHELGKAVPAVLLGRGRGAEQADQVVRLVRVAGPDLGAVDQPAALGLGGLGAGGEQVGAGVGLAHADGEAHLALADARQDIVLDALAAVPDDHRPALPVGDEVQPHRGVGDAKLLGDDVALQEAALVAAVFLGPGHADPALGADLAAELLAVGAVGAAAMRVEGAGLDLLGEEGAHLLAQRHALGRQADRVECQLCCHGSSLTAPPAWATGRRRPWPRPGCRA